MRRINLARPAFTDKEVNSIAARISLVLKSGWLTSGPLVEQLESQFKRVAGTDYAVATNSGTAALHILTSFLRLGRDAEVVVPANTFAATANAVLFAGAKPVLADCDPDSLNVTAETIENSLTPRTRGVFVTHVGGSPCEMNEISRLCRERGLHLMEDAAHAAGAKYKGRRCGSLARGSAFSLYPTKVITSGEGGFVCTSTKGLFEFAKLFRNAGRRKFGSGPILILGHNYRMSDIHAAIGLSQVDHIDEFVRRRNQLAAVYNQELERLDWIEPQHVAPHSLSSYYSYIVMLNRRARISRSRLRSYLQSKGIETTVMFVPVHKQPYFARYVGKRVSLRGAEAVGSFSLALPLHTSLRETEVEYVAKAIEKAPSPS